MTFKAKHFFRLANKKIYDQSILAPSMIFLILIKIKTFLFGPNHSDISEYSKKN